MLVKLTKGIKSVEELKYQTHMSRIKSDNKKFLQTKDIGKSCFWLDPNQQEILKNILTLGSKMIRTKQHTSLLTNIAKLFPKINHS